MTEAATKDDEKVRADLQKRMAMLFKLMLWSFVGLLAFVASQYTIYGERMRVEHRAAIYIGSAIALAIMAAIWRVLVNRPLSLARLRRIDIIYSLGIGTAFGASAYGQRELRAAAYMALVWATFTIFARALVVPSSARRTAILSALAFVPMTAAALMLSKTHQDLPRGGYLFGYLLLSIVPIVLATAGSYIIYGLRRQVSATEHLGQYTLDRRIGGGGMGSVYVAHHALLRRPAAVKFLPRESNSPDELARFEREVQSMSQLHHPNTVAVFDYGHTAEGGLYYAMEYLAPGIDLHALVLRDGPQPSDRIAAILVQICGALGEAHEKGLVHRDIKPGNIILCERGGVPDIAKVVDFGIARSIGDVAEIVGTPGYVAPETLTGGSVRPTADLYAVGAVGYFLLTGRRIFEGTPAEICAEQVRAEPVPPSQIAAIFIAPALEAIVMRCLAIDPAARPVSAEELAASLRALPHVGDWDEGRAREWWRERKEREIVVTSPPSADTITVDLGERVSA